jgi:hypothetical protein
MTKTMDFRIADTFTDSLARLTSDEKKFAKTTAFDLQLNPASPRHAVPQARPREGQELLTRSGACLFLPWRARLSFCLRLRALPLFRRRRSLSSRAH